MKRNRAVKHKTESDRITGELQQQNEHLHLIQERA